MDDPDAAAEAATGGAPQERLERWVERSINRRGLRPRAAAYLVVVVWLAAILIFGILQRLADPTTFPTIWESWWWAVQTVTTVGYGDIVPKQTAGKVVGAFLMLGGLSFLSVLTAMITSSFVARRQEASRASGEDTVVQVVARLDEISARLDAIQAELRGEAPPGETSPDPDRR